MSASSAFLLGRVGFTVSSQLQTQLSSWLVQCWRFAYCPASFLAGGPKPVPFAEGDRLRNDLHVGDEDVGSIVGLLPLVIPVALPPRKVVHAALFVIDADNALFAKTLAEVAATTKLD